MLKPLILKPTPNWDDSAQPRETRAWPGAHLGSEACKRFRILIEAWGEGIYRTLFLPQILAGETHLIERFGLRLVELVLAF